MSWFTSIRDAFQAAASIVGNYYLPGSGMITGQLVSEGAQEHLGSDLGRLGMIGSGVAGGVSGNMSNYGAAFNALGGIGGSTGSLVGNAAEGVGGAFSTTGGEVANFSAPAFGDEATRRLATFNQPSFGGAGDSNMTGFMGNDPLSQATPYADLVNGSTVGAEAGPYTLPNPSAANSLYGSLGMPPPGMTMNLGDTSSGMVPTTPGGAPVVERGTQFNGFPQGNGMGNDLWSMAKLAMQGSGGSSGGSMLGNAMSVGSGVYGMYQAQKMRQMAAMAAKRADPWGESGGRARAGGQLQGLLQDPSSITKMPGYEAGMEAVQRSMAAQGYVGSGNMMAALSKYGGDFYNNAVQQLGGLSGANQNPAASGQMEISGNVAANDLMSKGMASVGYGMTGTGGGTRFTPEMLLRMKASGMIQ